MHSKFDVCRHDGFEAHLFRKELADETVHIFVRAALPRGVGMRKEEVSSEFLGDSLMLGKLLSIVGCQRANTSRKRRQQRDHGVGYRLRGLERHMGDQRIARRAFIERDECLFLSSANHQVTLPVAEAATLGHYGGAQIKRRLTELDSEFKAIQNDEVYALWQSVQEAEAIGADPLGELATQIEVQIAEKRVELESLSCSCLSENSLDGKSTKPTFANGE